MATTYKVAGGDTLSAIAKKMGVKVSDISGYRSGNPNLIYPGEVLNIGTSAQPTVQPTIPKLVLPSTTIPSVGSAVKTTTPAIWPTKPTTAQQIIPSITGGATTVAAILPGQATPQPETLAQTTTQPPIITTTPSPTVGVSQIDAGKTAISELTKMGVSSDINTIRSNWQKFGLDTKLGQWIGSATQWNAYAKYAKDELERIQKGITEVRAGVTSIQEQMAEGIAPSTGTSPPLEPETVESLIDKIASGEISIPELEITKEEIELLKGKEKARVAQALETTQQQLATRGMTFSSIRSDAEARITAEHLANMSGISLKLASAIVQAARDEQARTAPKYQAVGGNLYEIIPGQEPRMIIEGEPQAPTIIGTSETGYFQWNSQTKSWESTGIQVIGKAPEVIGSATTGYYQWDSEKQTWVSTGIKAADSVIPPITLPGGQIVDISNVDGLRQAAPYLERASARAWLDINTDFTTPTIDNMLEAVYGKEMATSVSGQQQELAKDLMALDISSINAAAISAGMTPKKYIKEKIIKPAGFSPDDKFWEPFLDKFSGILGTTWKNFKAGLGL